MSGWTIFFFGLLVWVAVCAIILIINAGAHKHDDEDDSYTRKEREDL
jgi:hypothetical protein